MSFGFPEDLKTCPCTTMFVHAKRGKIGRTRAIILLSSSQPFVSRTFSKEWGISPGCEGSSLRKNVIKKNTNQSSCATHATFLRPSPHGNRPSGSAFSRGPKSRPHPSSILASDLMAFPRHSQAGLSAREPLTARKAALQPSTTWRARCGGDERR